MPKTTTKISATIQTVPVKEKKAPVSKPVSTIHIGRRKGKSTRKNSAVEIDGITFNGHSTGHFNF